MKHKTKSSQILQSFDFFEVKQDILENQVGDRITYTSLRFLCNSVAIIAHDLEKRFILIREYRHPIRETVLGCPGGKIEAGEDPLVGGRREFLEETGYDSNEIHYLGSAYPFPGGLDQKIHFLYIKNAIQVQEPNLDPFEHIEVVLKTQEELNSALRSSTPIDGILCTALHLAHVKMNDGIQKENP